MELADIHFEETKEDLASRASEEKSVAIAVFMSVTLIEADATALQTMPLLKAPPKEKARERVNCCVLNVDATNIIERPEEDLEKSELNDIQDEEEAAEEAKLVRTEIVTNTASD